MNADADLSIIKHGSLHWAGGTNHPTKHVRETQSNVLRKSNCTYDEPRIPNDLRIYKEVQPLDTSS